MSTERRRFRRYETLVSVDYASGEHFLFAYIQNISEMGIFIRSDAPLAVGTPLRLRFGLPDSLRLELVGEVAWVNHPRDDGDDINPGMGVRFASLTPEQREQVVALVRTIAYLKHPPQADPQSN